MAGFENYVEEAKEIELEIERKGIVLGIDWTNDVQVRALAKEALDQSAAEIKLSASSPIDRKLMAKVDLFGLAASCSRRWRNVLVWDSNATEAQPGRRLAKPFGLKSNSANHRRPFPSSARRDCNG
jgi:hypothetical protein